MKIEGWKKDGKMLHMVLLKSILLNWQYSVSSKVRKFQLVLNKTYKNFSAINVTGILKMQEYSLVSDNTNNCNNIIGTTERLCKVAGYRY